jgi:hypothetical protein
VQQGGLRACITHLGRHLRPVDGARVRAGLLLAYTDPPRYPPVQLPVLLELLLPWAALPRLPLHSSSTGHHVCILVLAADSCMLLHDVAPRWTAPGSSAAGKAGLLAGYCCASTAAVLASSPTAACLQYMHAPAGPSTQGGLSRAVQQ